MNEWGFGSLRAGHRIANASLLMYVQSRYEAGHHSGLAAETKRDDHLVKHVEVPQYGNYGGDQAEGHDHTVDSDIQRFYQLNW